MSTSSLLPLFLALPFLCAAALGVIPNGQRKVAAWIAAGAMLIGLALVAATAPAVFAGEVLRWRVEWMPTLGLDFSLRMDGLAWVFALLICGIGALVVLYAAYYLDQNDPASRFFLFLLLFKGAMLGVVLAGNLLLLAVFWEATSLASFLLIGYWRHRGEARDGARMALAVTGGGGLALLGGVVLIGHSVGSFDLDVVLASGAQLHASPYYVPALVLVLLGCFTKSAQFPFHFWLPHAMAAPTPVSAYLHSATMVKAGVFLLARLYPALGGSPEWFYLVTLTGLATLLVGAYLAIFQHDLKGLLAYSTVSQLGLITLLFGLDEPLAIVAGVFHILNHATFKASLFMAAGIIDHETGTRDMRKLNGLWRSMPWTGALAIVAAGAMAGVPLANGFLSKEMFFAETLAKETTGWMEIVLPAGAVLAGVLAVAYSTRFIHDVFFNGEPVGLTKLPHEPPRFMRIPVELLVLVVLAVGLFPGVSIGPLLEVAARAALYGPAPGAMPQYTLAVWHGLNLPLLLSACALLGGLALYFGLQKFINLHTFIHIPRGGKEAFFFGLDRLFGAARRLTSALESGSLQQYLFLLVCFAVLVGGFPLLVTGVQSGPQPLTPINLAFAAVWVIGLIAACGTVLLHRQRLMALLLLGAVGLVVSLCFVFLSAPDLALTQLLVEVVTIVLMMLALRWLPQASPRETKRGRVWRDALLSIVAGGGMATLAYLVLTRPIESIAPYFLSTAVPQGGGANVVNVIIVDFRGFDTLGEIAVLGIAGLIVYAVLEGFVPRAEQSAAAEPPRSLVLTVVSRLLLPMAALVSVYLFLRGHNAPGGGFIAGLVLAIALILQFVASGVVWASQRMGGDFRLWIGWGLLVAGLTGVGSWVVGSPFLTTSYDYPELPLLGPVPLASAAVFDLGVYLTVVGATMVALVSIARLRTRTSASS